MILGFSTQLNGKATNFVEKIWDGLLSKGLCNSEEMWEFENQYQNEFSDNLDFSKANISKLHTIREDPKDRWKVGMLIDFFINVRTKKMFRFAPVLPVVSTQEVFMTKRGNEIEITVSKVGSYIGGDDFYLHHAAKQELAINDGFDSLEDFNSYFSECINEIYNKTGNNWFKGKIIHWTNFKY